MRIGIDIDDTITNSYELIFEQIGKYYNVNSYMLMKKGCKYEDILANEEKFPDYQRFSREVVEGLIPTVSIKQGAKEVIKKLKDEGNEIILITARNAIEYSDPLNLTINFLKENDIYYDELHIAIKDKGKFCQENKINVLIDDSIRNCTSAKLHEIPHLLLDNTFNRDNQELNRVYGWQDVYDNVNMLKNELMQES